MFVAFIISTVPFILLFAGMAAVALFAIGALVVKFPFLIALALVYACGLKIAAAPSRDGEQREDSRAPASCVNPTEPGLHCRRQKIEPKISWPSPAWTVKSAHGKLVATQSAPVNRA
ncbi:MAG TPA: hypothetical protein VI457_07875 [Methylococcaceae bacterium]|nr:hypothetical protein [Methylococcaceae bacterium]